MTHTQTAFADGVVAHVRPGSGERVLWLHGYTMNSSIWDELWDLLPGHHHIGVDLPGHGSSERIAPSANLRTVAQLIGRAALASRVRHIVGLSFGTVLGLQIAIELPVHFQTVTLAAPALAGGPQDNNAGERYIEMLDARRAGASRAQLTELWMRSPPDIFKGAEAHPQLYSRLANVISEHHWRELDDASMLRLTQPPQIRASLERIRAAATIIVGDQELPAFRSCAAIIYEAIPQADLYEVADAGHLCLLERPKESAALLAGILDSSR